MIPPSDLDKWFVCPQPQNWADRRLFFFPYAGGGPTAFSKWCLELPDSVEGWVAHYPGRGSRHNEPPITILPALIENLSRAMHLILNKPFAFFGHSFGGLAAFELARQLRRKNLPQPNILFVSACGAPHISDPYLPIHALPEFEFMYELKQLNGIPPEILQVPEAMKLLLPAVRADFEAIETYHYQDEAPLECPVVAFGGLHDSRVSRERLEGWAEHTTSGYTSQYFPGGHFFINTERDAVIESMIREFNSPA